MIQVRRADQRGHFDHGWLDTYHTFSFGEYHDPRWMGFRSLRVINDDRVAPGHGFPTHGHRDMEILTYVLEGALEHQDSLGTGSVIRPGDVQRMSAGTGVRHSETNPSPAEPVHLLQIWILPESEGIPPSYEQKTFDLKGRQGKLQLVATRGGRGGAVRLHQDASLYLAELAPGDEIRHRNLLDRHVWIQVARGAVEVKSRDLRAGDGIAVSEEELVAIKGLEPAEILLFDLA